MLMKRGQAITTILFITTSHHIITIIHSMPSHHYSLPQHHLDHASAHEEPLHHQRHHSLHVHRDYQEDPCGRGEVFNKRQNLVEEQSQRKEEELWRTQSRGERRCICICETSSKKTYLYLLDIIRENVFLFV